VTQVETDLVFATTEERELALDIYRAPDRGAPVTRYVHGGGWRPATRRTTARGGPRRCTPGSGAGYEGAGFDRPASLALTAAWLRATLAGPATR
jgi:hypothetical protein